jgi:TonB family protein
MKMALASSRPVLLALAASFIFSPMGRAADAPSVTGAKPAIPASPLAISEQEIDKRLEGKFLFLRGFYLDDKLEFDINGKVVGGPQKGSFTLSALEVKKVRATKKTIVIEADRIGLHFFGGLPYEDDDKPFERIKVSKKPLEITIDRLVIEPEKKKKKHKGDDKQVAAKPATTPAGAPAAAGSPAPGTTTEASTSGVANPPDVTFDEADANSSPDATATRTDLTAKAAPAALPKAAPVDPAHHDPKESWQQLSKALDQVFAPGLDDSVIATLPDYWQVYFATKAGKTQEARIDNSVLRPGTGVVSPKLLSSLEPASNDYAQKNNIAGMTLLSTVVGASGKPGNVTIVRPIGFGLDEQAVDAVERAHFRPGMHDGQAVPVVVNVQVTFRIYSERTRPQPGSAAEPAPPATPASAPAPTHSNGNGKEVAVVSQH